MKKILLTGLTAAVLSANAFAGEVTGYTAPQSGQAATAAGVDANFQALISAINDNSQRLDALEAAEVGGSVEGAYTFVELAIELAANSGTGLTEAYSEISSYSSSGSFTLEAGGNFSGTINENRSTLFDTQNGDCATEGCRDTFDPDFGNTVSEPLSGTWSDDGSTVTLTLGPGDTVVLQKAGPNLLILSQKDTVTTEGEPIYDFTNIAFLIKQ